MLRFIREFGALYLEKRLTRAAAALSYFLTMTLFPFLIILYTLLGNSYGKAMRVLEFAKRFIAAESAEAIAEFLRYVAVNNSKTMMIAALIVLVTSASAAVRSLQATIGEMQGGPRYRGLRGVVFSIVFSLVFVAAIYFAMLVMLTGREFIRWLNGVLPFVDISRSWNVLRFIVLGAIDFAIVWAVYGISRRRGEDYPTAAGAFFATLAMVGVSIAFSAVIGASARYPLVYGSLASVILLMFWIYTACLVICCGAAFNIALRNVFAEEKPRRFEPNDEE